MNYKPAGSKDVRIVNEVNIVDKESHPKTTKGNPNSVTKLIHDGQVDQERYYDENGDVYPDIDYSDHRNPKNIQLFHISIHGLKTNQEK